MNLRDRLRKTTESTCHMALAVVAANEASISREGFVDMAGKSWDEQQRSMARFDEVVAGLNLDATGPDGGGL